MNDTHDVDVTVDACQLDCPLPLLKAKQALNKLEVGQCVRVLATDAGSVRDFKVFAEQSGNKLLYSSEDQGVYSYVLQKQ